MKLTLIAPAPAIAQKAFVGLSAGVSASTRTGRLLGLGLNPVVTGAGKLEIGIRGKSTTDFGLQLFATTWRMAAEVIYTDIDAQPIGRNTLTVDFARPAVSALLFVRKNLGKGGNGFRATLAAGGTYAIADESMKFENVAYSTGQAM